jgi:hypothetical protein
LTRPQMAKGLRYGAGELAGVPEPLSF